MEIVEVDYSTIYRFIAKTSVNILIVYSENCSICEDYLNTVSQMNFSEEVSIAKIELDEHMDILKAFGIRGTPQTFIYKNGELVNNASGVLRPFRLEKLVNRYVNE